MATTTKEKIEVMQAFEDGEKIESRWLEGEKWEIADTPTWNWQYFDYRIKAEMFKFEAIFETTKNSSFTGAIASMYEALMTASFKVESCKKYKITIEEVTE